MEFNQYKLFIAENFEELEAVKIDGMDYYSFVRSKMDEGYSQIVISSGIMLRFLKVMFIKKKAKIVKIDFIEDDIQYSEQMDKFVSEVNNDRDYFYELMKELSFLAEQESVEIKNIRVKYRIDGKLVDLSLSVNGLIKAGESGIEDQEITYISQEIWKSVRELI